MNTKLAIDLDEVLVPLLRPMAKWHGVRVPTIKHKYLYRHVFNCSEERAQQILQGFYDTEEFAKLEPLPGARCALEMIRKVGWDKIYIVTGRQDIVRQKTELWVDKHFPGIFDDVVLTNSFTSFEVPKSDICKSLGVSLLVDDSIDNCREAQMLGIDAINFIGFDENVYPWCEPTDISFQDWTTMKLDDLKCV